MANDPSLWELKNLIERNHADAREDYVDLKAQVARDINAVQQQTQQFVLREVYEAREAAMLQRISALEEQTKTARAQVRSAVYTAIGAIVATVLSGITWCGGEPR